MRSLTLGADEIHELTMDPVVSTDFRVERRGHHVAFSDGEDPTCGGPVIDLGKDLHSRSDLPDPGGADEDRGHLVGEVRSDVRRVGNEGVSTFRARRQRHLYNKKSTS